MKMIRTRFAPSPTGMVHVGNLRTALFSYLYAKRMGGIFMLRIEDTDRERLVEGAVENLLSTLAWTGILPDEGVVGSQNGKSVVKGAESSYIQSERLDIYKKYIQILLDNGHAYYAFDTKQELDEMRKRQELNKQATRYERATMKNQFTLGEVETKRLIDAGTPYVIRMKVPEDGTTSFNDLIRGEIRIENREVDDQVLMKADGFPTYHFAVVVDDHIMEITHVIRGEDWISSTPKHILLYQMFGWEIPEHAHLPLLINEQKQKLSKRHGDVSVEDFRKKGYLPEALVNFIALLGWNPGTEQELFSLDELARDFDLGRVSKSGAVFNREKLNWYNQQYIRALSLDELAELVAPYFEEAGYDVNDREWLKRAVALEQERAATLSEIPSALGFLFELPKYDPQLLVWKKSTLEDAMEKLKLLVEFLRTVEDWETASLEVSVMNWIKEKGFGTGDVLWPMRVAMSGQKNSPGPFEIAGVLGKEETLRRVGEVGKY